MRQVYDGNIVQVVQYDVDVWGWRTKVFEKARRAPWVRMLIVDPEGRFLLTREYRYELDAEDYRLPGGKVVDSLHEYLPLIGSDLTEHVLEAARREALEEAWLVVHDPQVVLRDICGTTMEWDLYYVIVRSFEMSEEGQTLESGEYINLNRFTPVEVLELLKSGEVKEWRTRAFLYDYLNWSSIFTS